MKILYITDDSVIGGVVRSGVAEVVDSLANSVAEDSAHTVCVICPDGNSSFVRMAFGVRQESGYRSCKLLGVNYYLLPRGEDFPARAAALADDLKPDVLHNFAGPDLLTLMSAKPARAIYTIDRSDFVCGKEKALTAYNAVTTVSRAYAAELLAGGDALAETLAGMDFRGITNGILTTVLNPANGLFLERSYKSEDMTGKADCKRRLLDTYGIPGDDPCVYLYMGRLAREKGIDAILDAVDTIRTSGGFLLVVGKGDKSYEDRLSYMTRGDGVLWIDRWASPMQMLPLLSGADYYLSPSLSEPCGLMPMTACRYGVIPITTLAGGLADNMDSDIAVIIEDGVTGAVERASKLYADKDALASKRKVCMERDFSWAARKSGYLDIYGC